MIEIIKPKVEIEDIVEGKESRFIAEPLERGFGQTLGNSLRRILLGALPGAAPVGIRITGVNHEFTSIEGIKEDVTEMILNIKGLAVKAHTDDRNFRQIATIRKYDAGVVTAADTAQLGYRDPQSRYVYLHAGRRREAGDGHNHRRGTRLCERP